VTYPPQNPQQGYPPQAQPPYAPAPPQQPYQGYPPQAQPPYPPAPPQGPPPGYGQPPYAPAAPQPPYPPAGQPYQGYGPPQGYGAPQSPPMPVTGNMDDYINQPTVGVQDLNKFFDNPGQELTVTVSGPLKVEQTTNYQTRVPEFWNDRRPKMQMLIPVAFQPNYRFTDGRAVWRVKAWGNLHDELFRAMSAAGLTDENMAKGPEQGASITILRLYDKPVTSNTGAQMTPAKQWQVTYYRPGSPNGNGQASGGQPQYATQPQGQSAPQYAQAPQQPAYAPAPGYPQAPQQPGYQQQPPPAAYAQPGNPALAALAGAPQPGVPGAGGTSEFTAAGQSWQPPEGQPPAPPAYPPAPQPGQYEQPAPFQYQQDQQVASQVPPAPQYPQPPAPPAYPPAPQPGQPPAPQPYGQMSPGAQVANATQAGMAAAQAYQQPQQVQAPPQGQPGYAAPPALSPENQATLAGLLGAPVQAGAPQQ
jgi:hypothetical protein